MLFRNRLFRNRLFKNGMCHCLYFLCPTMSIAFFLSFDACASETYPSPFLEEVLVTAQKRLQPLHHIPLSVAVIYAESIQQSGSKDVSEAVAGTANVNIDNNITLAGSGSTSSIYIRGIGQSDFLTTTDPGVGIYVDGVYISRSIGSLLDVSDLERIEVLRGPQGTLYGKNTIGGAINVISQKPTKENQLAARITLGDDQKKQLHVMANASLSEATQARLSVNRYYQDGYVSRTVGENLGQDNTASARLSVSSQLTEKLSLYMSADAFQGDQTAGASVLVETFELCPAGVSAPFCDANAPLNTAPGQVFLFNHSAPVTVAADGDASLSHYGDEWIPLGSNSSGTAEAISQTDIWGLHANLDYQLPFGQLTSISSIRQIDSYFSRDADHSPYRIYHTRADVNHQQVSQEIQLSSDPSQNDIMWQGGLYYLAEKATDNSQIDMASMGIQSGGKDINNTSYAFFLNSEFQLTDTFSFILGARTTKEDKKYTPTQWITYSVLGTPPAGLVIIPEEVNSETYSATSYKLALNYSLNDNVRLYSSLSTGFKSGGFVQRNQLSKSELPRFNPETAKTFEVGMHGQYFEDRLQMNMALFHTDYSDIQVRIIEVAGFAPITANAARATIQGAEWDAIFVLGDQINLSSSIGYIDARYTEIGDSLADINTDSKFVNTPDFTAAITVNHTANILGKKLQSRLQWLYSSEVYNDAENTESLKQAANHIVNMSVHMTSPNSRWETTVGIRNIFDDDLIVSGNANRSLGSTVASYNRGRDSYFSLGYTF